MAYIRWEPVPVNRLFTSLFDTPTATSRRGNAAAPARRFAPATDLAESDTHYLVRLDLPGVSEDDINVELDGNVLSISGQREAQSGSRTGGYHHYERTSGAFRRSVRLPEGVDAEAITANFDRGVLEVTVPKPVSATPRKVAVTIGDAPRAIDSTPEPAESAEDAGSQEPIAA
jgi:HSP20 family protein